jgi:hypothetical protein
MQSGILLRCHPEPFASLRAGSAKDRPGLRRYAVSTGPFHERGHTSRPKIKPSVPRHPDRFLAALGMTAERSSDQSATKISLPPFPVAP